MILSPSILTSTTVESFPSSKEDSITFRVEIGRMYSMIILRCRKKILYRFLFGLKKRKKNKRNYYPAFPRIKGFATNISRIESYFSISRMLHGYFVNAQGVSMKVSFVRIMHYVIYVAYRLTRIRNVTGGR